MTNKKCLKEVKTLNLLLCRLSSIQMKIPQCLDEESFCEGYNDCLEDVLKIVANTLEPIDE
jgi:hypothetical protein